MKRIPNVITMIRLLLSITLLCILPYSRTFYIVYLLCGVGDVLDGYLARKYDCSSKFGAVLDSVADGLFVLILFVKLVPVIHVHYSVLIFVIIISVIKVASIIVGFVRWSRFVMLHTYGNKVTGLITFFLILFYKFIASDGIYYIVCSVAVLAAIEELIINIIFKEIDLNIKGLLIHY